MSKTTLVWSALFLAIAISASGCSAGHEGPDPQQASVIDNGPSPSPDIPVEPAPEAPAPEPAPQPAQLGATECGEGTGQAARLVWDVPTLFTDGSGATISDVSGYVIYYGTSPRSYAVRIEINDPTITMCTIAGLSEGTYYFAVTAIDQNANESGYSNEKTRTFVAAI